MPDCSKAKLYKIINSISNDLYIGSTTQRLCSRMSGHRQDCTQKKSKEYPLYKNMKELGIERFAIQLIEECPCKDRGESYKKEGEWIRNEQPTLNKQVAGRTHHQWYIDNKEHHNNKCKEYRMIHETQLSSNKKNYIEHNQEMIQQNNKELYENNKERILQQLRERVLCECGKYFTKQYESRHKSSKYRLDKTMCV